MEQIEARVSSRSRIVVLVFITGLLVDSAVGFLLFVLIGARDPIMIAVFVALTATTILFCLRYWFTPRLVISNRGVSYRPRQLSMLMVSIPWQEIESVGLEARSGRSQVLVFNLRNTEQFIASLSRQTRINLRTMSRTFDFSEFAIPVQNLTTEAEEVYSLVAESLERHRQGGAKLGLSVA